MVEIREIIPYLVYHLQCNNRRAGWWCVWWGGGKVFYTIYFVGDITIYGICGVVCIVFRLYTFYSK